MGLRDGLRIRKRRDKSGETQYSYQEKRSDRYDRSKEKFDWTDLDYEFYELRKTLILPNILMLFLVFACSFATINPLVSQAVIPYLYISSIVCVISYLAMYSLLTTWIHLAILIIYGAISIVSSLIFLSLRLFTECTSAYCADEFASSMTWILVILGVGLSTFYILFGILQCRTMQKVLRARDRLSGKGFIKIEQEKVGSSILKKKKKRKMKGKAKNKKKKKKKKKNENIPLCKSTDKTLLTDFDVFNLY